MLPKSQLWPFFALLFAISFPAMYSPALDRVSAVRLYALDCGHVELSDMAMFSDTGEYSGKSGKLAESCFIIQHPNGILLWDTGMGDELARRKAGLDQGGIHMTVSVTLVDQLAKLGMTPADVTYVGFSHFHFDHTSNANLFKASTWIINQTELNWALGDPTPPGVNPASFSAYKNVKTKLIDGDYDVFGDGTVRILKAPGHTPGHQVLQIELKKSGTVILSGDLYHLRENYQYHRVPDFNYSRADTLASMDRIEKIIQNKKARLVIQHDPQDFNSMPKLPFFLD